MKLHLRKIIRWLWGWQSPYECYWRDRALRAEKELRQLRGFKAIFGRKVWRGK